MNLQHVPSICQLNVSRIDFNINAPKQLGIFPPPKKKYTLSVVCGGFTNMSGNICINWAEHFILHTF